MIFLFFVAVRRRQNKPIEHEKFLLTDWGEKDNCWSKNREKVVKKPKNIVKNREKCRQNWENVVKTGINDGKSTQSKVKKSKVKESK